MSEARKLLIRALDVLEEMRMTDCPDWELGDDIRAELEKPGPVEYRTITLENGRLTALTQTTDLHHGKYRLLAERLPD